MIKRAKKELQHQIRQGNQTVITLDEQSCKVSTQRIDVVVCVYSVQFLI